MGAGVSSGLGLPRLRLCPCDPPRTASETSKKNFPIPWAGRWAFHAQSLYILAAHNPESKPRVCVCVPGRRRGSGACSFTGSLRLRPCNATPRQDRAGQDSFREKPAAAVGRLKPAWCGAPPETMSTRDWAARAAVRKKGGWATAKQQTCLVYICCFVFVSGFLELLVVELCLLADQPLILLYVLSDASNAKALV